MPECPWTISIQQDKNNYYEFLDTLNFRHDNNSCNYHFYTIVADTQTLPFL